MYSGRLDKGDKFACFILDHEPRDESSEVRVHWMSLYLDAIVRNKLRGCIAPRVSWAPVNLRKYHT